MRMHVLDKSERPFLRFLSLVCALKACLDVVLEISYNCALIEFAEFLFIVVSLAGVRVLGCKSYVQYKFGLTLLVYFIFIYCIFLNF